MVVTVSTRYMATWPKMRWVRDNWSCTLLWMRPVS